MVYILVMFTEKGYKWLFITFFISVCYIAYWQGHIKWNVVGNKITHIYHIPTCPFAQRMNKNDKIILKNPEEAINNGYTPCHICQPPEETEEEIEPHDRRG